MNNKPSRILIFLAFFACIGLQAQGQIIIDEAKTNADLLLKESMEGLSFSMQTQHMEIKEVAAGGKTYFTLEMGEGYTPSKAIGSPQLPLYNRLIEIPYGATIEIHTQNIEKQHYDISQYTKAKLIPKQAPLTKSQEGEGVFALDQSIYNSNKYFGNDLVSVEVIGVMGSVRLARLSISPIRYNPKTNSIELVKSFSASISFHGADLKATTEAREKCGHSAFLDKRVLNSKNLSSVCSSSVIERPLKLVVVSDTIFEDILQPFLAWKRQQGFQVVELYIGRNSLTRDTNSIRSALKSIYDNATALSPAADYVLLCGDVNLLPTFTGTYSESYSQEYFPTDLYYAQYTSDYLPDAFYGRLSAQTPTQLQHIIDKTMSYEKYQMADTAHLGKVLLIAGKETGSNAPTYGNGQINYLKKYIVSNPHTDTLIYYNPASGNYSSQIKDSISLNGYGFINYSAHCSEEGWYSPSLLVSDINNTINNTGKYPLFINNCCLSNKFSESECFGEAVLRAENKGGVGAIGGSCYTFWDGDYYWSVGAKDATLNSSYNANKLGSCDRLFHSHGEDFSQWNISAGQIIQAGNLAVLQANVDEDEYYFKIYHVLGDPTLIPYIGMPAENINNIPDTLSVGINFLQLVCAPYSYVGVSKDDSLLGAAQADSLGSVHVNFNAPIDQIGYMKTVITTQFAKPVIDSTFMTYQQEPLMAVKSVSFTDTASNPVSKLKNSQIYNMRISVQNYGLSGLDSLRLSLANNSNIIFIDSIAYLGHLDGKASQSATLKVRVANDIQDGSLAAFDLKIKGLNYADSKSYSFRVNAPKINIVNLSIKAPNGFVTGGNINISFDVKNIGGNLSDSGTVSVGNLSDNITLVSDSVFAFAALQPNQSKHFSITFNLGALSSDITNYLVFKINAIANNYYNKQIDSIPLKLNLETFESGDLLSFNWTYDSYPWYIDTVKANAHQGHYSLRSAKITDSKISTISLSSYVMSADSVSFYMNTSTEASYDIAHFYIDGLLKLEVSGTQNWKRYVFAVDTGTHTFTWDYNKDYSNSNGSDAVWIDDVCLPMTCTTSSLANVNANKLNVSLYPNPANDIVWIKGLSNKSVLSLFDCVGNRVEVNYSNTSLNVSHLKSGVYYLQIKEGSVIEMKKIIIAR